MTESEQQELLALQWWFSKHCAMTRENKAKLKRLKELITKCFTLGE